ncbi:hypothetical protein LP417_09165 [Polaromonas sp. P1-6]|nr:hypothetical protein LP417_09165 [Polaromonas sp. P1-6]
MLGRSSPATMRSSVDLPAARGAEDGDEVVVVHFEVDRQQRLRALAFGGF